MFMMMGHGSGDNREAGYGHHFGIGKMLGTTSISERGQVVIPDKARKELDISADDMFVVFGNKRRGALILIKSEVFEGFAEAFMSKLGKLEKYAQDFFRQGDGIDGAGDDTLGDGAGAADDAGDAGEGANAGAGDGKAGASDGKAGSGHKAEPSHDAR
jgi:bifunctional DNA-binding transcriptional regulator/antitoxin component of YhaV-PrlF toxin-antitoxin module